MGLVLRVSRINPVGRIEKKISDDFAEYLPLTQQKRMEIRMKTDEEFRKKVLECKDAKKRMGLVKAEGFDFTEKDIKVVNLCAGLNIFSTV